MAFIDADRQWAGEGIEIGSVEAISGREGVHGADLSSRRIPSREHEKRRWRVDACAIPAGFVFVLSSFRNRCHRLRSRATTLTGASYHSGVGLGKSNMDIVHRVCDFNGLWMTMNARGRGRGREACLRSGSAESRRAADGQLPRWPDSHAPTGVGARA